MPAPVPAIPIARATTLIASSLPLASPHMRQPQSILAVLATPHRLSAPPNPNREALPAPWRAQTPAVELRVVFATPSDAISSAPPPEPAPIAPPLSAVLARPSQEKLILSLGTLVRPGSGSDAFAPGAQLGGSQTGLRLYAPIAHSLALTGQANTPLTRSAGAEASLGLALRLPHFTLLAERRIAIGREGRNDFAFTAAGGVDQVRLPAGGRLDAYAQAGVVGNDGFADGAVRIERAVTKGPGVVIAAGAGVWGGIQPGASRVDIGPQLVAHFRLGTQIVRIGAEWRERIAGDARPPSGPALTLGADF